MKKLFAFVACFFALCLVADEDIDLKINGDFKGSKLNAAQPVYWVKNYANNPKIGASRIIATNEPDEFALEVKTTAVATPFYSLPHRAKAGDRVKISIDAKGSGQIMFKCYVYDANQKYVGILYGKPIKLTSSLFFSEYKEVITLHEFPGKNPIGNVRIVFAALKDTNVVFKDVEAELYPKR